MTIIIQLEITSERPEKMRVIRDGALYLVQIKSGVTEQWFTAAEHRNEKDALLDCVNWY